MRSLLPITFVVPALFLLACSLRQQPPPGASGAEIYRLQNCANCHGEEREGTRRGPPLAGLDEHWTAERLAEYLSDPGATIAGDARLRAMDEDFGSSNMGRYDNLDPEQRRTLAAWLLAGGPL